jgi:hypothetical protein
MSVPARYLAIACASALITGCHQVTTYDGECFFICNPAVDYALVPDSTHMLRGDTATFYTKTCEANSLCLNSHVASSWVIEGDALATIAADGTPAPIIGTPASILVRAIAVGHSDITATAIHNPSRTETVRIHVADSSVITRIDIVNFGAPLTSVKVGREFPVAGILYDADGTRYTAPPSEWSVTDSTVLAIGPPLSVHMGDRQITAIKPGTAEIHARFLGVTAVMPLTVTP